MDMHVWLINFRMDRYNEEVVIFYAIISGHILRSGYVDTAI